MTIETRGHRPPDRYLPPLVSWEDFLTGIGEERRAEWVDGEIIDMPPANLGHQDILGFLHLWIGYFVGRFRLGRVYLPPALMHLPSRPSGREPDLMFVANEHLDRLTRQYVEGPADLVVEIVSPDSIVRDRRDKLDEYQEAGVPEYWVIDELRQAALFYVLSDDGRYQLVPIDDDGIYTSTMLPRLRLRVSWLWQTPPPTLDDALTDLPYPGP
jgi:Uma2 family endonuclease